MEREEIVRSVRVAQQVNQEATEAMFAALSELKAVGDALGTDETGKALVEVARSAHEAEQREAVLLSNVNRVGLLRVIRSAYGWLLKPRTDCGEARVRLQSALAQTDCTDILAVLQGTEVKS